MTGSQIGFCADSPIKQDNIKDAGIEYHGDNYKSFAGQGVASADTLCIYVKCPNNKTLRNNACVAKQNPAPVTPTPGNGGGAVVAPTTCRNDRTTDEGKACCDLPTATAGDFFK